MAFKADTTAVTTGTLENPEVVCVADVTESDVIIAEFTRDELEARERCARCNKIVGNYGAARTN